LAEIANCGEELGSFRVPRAACEACVRELPPSALRLNPVVASFLYSAAEEIVNRGGTPTCDLQRANDLQEWAKEFVEVEAPGRRSPLASQRSYRECRHLGDVLGYRQEPSIQGLVRTAVYACHHPDHNTTTEADCIACRDWSRMSHETSIIKLADTLPRPDSWGSTGPNHWAVGITTAPRRVPTLHATLEHVRRAGWDRVRLAVDGKASLPPGTPVEQISLRSPAVGAWPNFYLTLLELVLGESEADAILLIQDDVQFYDRENVRDYLDGVLWPRETPGIVSLYCPAAYTRETAGWSVADERWEWGALAFVFPAELAGGSCATLW
jgi:hypothetical protein